MRIVFLMLIALVSPLALAETKVAVVDMERALFLSDEAKAAAKKFEDDNAEAIGKVRSLEDAMMALKEKKDKDGDIMGQDELNKLASDYDEKARERQFYLDKLQKQDQQWRQGFFRSKLPSLEEKLKSIIEEGKYDVVLQAGAVVYSHPSADLTKVLLERLNAK
ncbi:OmpH family outer membrane protein [Oceanobacter mangrovi]|uniref:OmpH family outer membrane protein n=1 Tax=Oceanobacter mangrovi TaxID=2862510 RepID=UPI001C8EE8DE|nr:OmpH family outer membrane protein [Oceanobacter mangrovi]